MLYSSFFCVCLWVLSVKFSWCFQVLYTFADWLCGLVKHNNLPILSLFVTSCLLFSVLFYVLLRNPCGVVAGSSQKTVILGRSPQGGCKESGRKLYDYMSEIPLIFCIRSLSVSLRVFFLARTLIQYLHSILRLVAVQYFDDLFQYCHWFFLSRIVFLSSEQQSIYTPDVPARKSSLQK